MNFVSIFNAINERREVQKDVDSKKKKRCK